MLGCNTTFYGTNCSGPCTCIEANTDDCIDSNGTCQCKSGWSGVNCELDDNECTTNQHNCNSTLEECVNDNGGFRCVCIYGNSSTGCIGESDLG